MAGDERLRRGRVAEAAIVGSRNVCAGAKVLGKTFGALQRRRCRARPEGRDPFPLERVDEAQHERRLGPDHDKIDPLAAAESDKPRDVGCGNCDTLALLGDAGIAGRTEEPIDQR